jgi:segregation and condensation protein A
MMSDAADGEGNLAVLGAATGGEPAGAAGAGAAGAAGAGRAGRRARPGRPAAPRPGADRGDAGWGDAGRDATGPGGAAAAADETPTGRGGRTDAFVVELENFSGPFDLLLHLIAKHKMDVTEVALSKVTDEFVAHIRRLGERFDLGQATEFLVVAATLLDLKAARLLPGAISDDESEDLALLEARDLLFARLLQYKAYKEAAAIFTGLMALESRHTPRGVPLEPRYAAVLPEVVIRLTPEELAAIAARLREPPLPPQVATDHVHAPRVNVREHMLAVVEMLQRAGAAGFWALCAGCTQTIEVVARFLALLELYREERVRFEQQVPLGELTVRWVEAAPGGAGAAVVPGDGGDGLAGGEPTGGADEPDAGDGTDDGRRRPRRPRRRRPTPTDGDADDMTTTAGR